MNIKKAKGIFFRVRSLEFLLFAWKDVKKKKNTCYLYRSFF